MAQACIGVDVSKDWIDVWERGNGHARLANAPRDLLRFARDAAGRGVLVTFEATGSYDRALRAALDAAGVVYARVNPRQARDFARAMGLVGKTDRVDARMLGEMGARLALRRSEATPPARRALQALTARRRQLVEARKQETCRLKQAADAFLCRSHRRQIAVLTREIARVEAEIEALTERDPELAAAARRLRTAPGVGPVAAATLIAEMPELGTLDRRAAAALAGLAPVARDSGRRRPAREIAGGRPTVRSILYLAALAASRRHPRFKAFRDRLEGRGKCKKAAIVAVARKLLTCLNSMLRDSQDFVDTTA